MNPDSKYWEKGKAIEKLFHTIQSTAICREKYYTMLSAHHNFEYKQGRVSNTKHMLKLSLPQNVIYLRY